MAQQPPIFLLAHGAWHPPHLYSPLKAALAARGYDLLVPHLPTLGHGVTGLTVEDDAAALVSVAESLFVAGRAVIIIGHSYGGLPACVATRGNSVLERAEVGLPGGFLGLVCLCAFAMPARGMSVLSLSGGNWLSWHKLLELKGGGGQLFVQDHAKHQLYNDLPPAVAQQYWDSLAPSSLDAFVTGVNFVPRDANLSKTYIICEKDELMAPMRQEKMSTCGFDQVFRLPGGHSSFASIPDQVADALVKVAEGLA